MTQVRAGRWRGLAAARTLALFTAAGLGGCGGPDDSDACSSACADASAIDSGPGTDSAASVDSGPPGTDSSVVGSDSAAMGSDACAPCTDAAPPGTDAIPPPSDSGPMPVSGADSDGDGLEDFWEIYAGDAAYLTWNNADTDGDGLGDGAEDYDGDGLTSLEEYALARLTSAPAADPPNPLRKDVLVELDSMSGYAPSDAVLGMAVAAYAAIALPGVGAGSGGVGLHFYRDEESIAPFDFDGSFSQRTAFFSGHGPTYTDTASPPIPYSKFVHVGVVTLRTDVPGRGGEVVVEIGGSIENTGALIYYDALAALNPQCAVPPLGLPDITLDEAVASTLVHEIGHLLQLGHDTSAGGSVNYWNVMSVPTSCMEAQQRFHGYANTDPALGATTGGGSRFSAAAAALMAFTNKLSVDTSEMVDTDGVEM